MVKIDWNSSGKRIYNAGLDRSVLYTYGNPGVPWFGLYSIEETTTGGEPKPFYMDGVKYLNLSSTTDFQATLNALQYPSEFEPCIGMGHLAQGLITTQQERVPFGLCYRTLIGSDTQSLGFAYKLHIIYRAIAAPSQITHTTLHGEASMEYYSWEITTLPYRFSGMKPIAHLIVDSRIADPTHLTSLEGYLYGTSENDPMLLDPGQITAILSGEMITITED